MKDEVIWEDCSLVTTWLKSKWETNFLSLLSISVPPSGHQPNRYVSQLLQLLRLSFRVLLLGHRQYFTYYLAATELIGSTFIIIYFCAINSTMVAKVGFHPSNIVHSAETFFHILTWPWFTQSPNWASNGQSGSETSVLYVFGFCALVSVVVQLSTLLNFPSSHLSESVFSVFWFAGRQGRRVESIPQQPY